VHAIAEEGAEMDGIATLAGLAEALRPLQLSAALSAGPPLVLGLLPLLGGDEPEVLQARCPC